MKWAEISGEGNVCLQGVDGYVLKMAGVHSAPQSRRKVTLISAPAGFGKTKQLSEWVAARSDSTSDLQNQNRRPSRLAMDRQV